MRITLIEKDNEIAQASQERVRTQESGATGTSSAGGVDHPSVGTSTSSVSAMVAPAISSTVSAGHTTVGFPTSSVSAMVAPAISTTVSAGHTSVGFPTSSVSAMVAPAISSTVRAGTLPSAPFHHRGLQHLRWSPRLNVSARWRSATRCASRVVASLGSKSTAFVGTLRRNPAPRFTTGAYGPTISTNWRGAC